jgi:hypothetical protein
MSDDKNFPQDLEADPVYQLAAENGFNLLDFCIEQLEPNGMAETEFWQAEDEEELQVGQNCANEDQLTSWQQIAEYELQQVTTEMANKTETTQSNAAEINTAREWLDINDDDSPESLTDILEIVKRFLKEVKQLKTGCTVKMMTQLTAVAEYVKL